MNITESVSKRFWAKVDKSSDCWVWTASLDDKGYGQLGVDKRPLRAHRISYRIQHGEIPDGLHVLHHCDNPPCVRPDHLFLGTHADNMADMCKKGRHYKGETHPNVKLTEGDVLTIRGLYSEGMRLYRLAGFFGMSISTIHNIVNRTTWRHI